MYVKEDMHNSSHAAANVKNGKNFFNRIQIYTLLCNPHPLHGHIPGETEIPGADAEKIKKRYRLQEVHFVKKNYR